MGIGGTGTGWPAEPDSEAIEMDSDHMFHLNFAITLFNHGELTEAASLGICAVAVSGS